MVRVSLRCCREHIGDLELLLIAFTIFMSVWSVGNGFGCEMYGDYGQGVVGLFKSNDISFVWCAFTLVFTFHLTLPREISTSSRRYI